MWITKAIELVGEAIKSSKEPLANEKECEAYAKAAYQYCIGLYGPPADSKQAYVLTRGVSSDSGCSYILGKYTITLSPELETLDQLCMVIGHEMYHRITMRRKGLRRQIWIDEMLAFLTSLWFLQQQGFSSYAEYCIGACQESADSIDLNALRTFRRPPWHKRLRDLSQAYPENFYTDIARVAVALKRIVDGNDLCRILKATTVDEWIASLPPAKQYAVCRVLEMPSDGKKMPETARDLDQFSRALEAKGDQALVIAEIAEVIRLQPENGGGFFYLGLAYQQARDFQVARDAYLTAIDLNFSDKWLPFNLGTTYWYLEDFASAARWYQEASTQNPDWAKASYYLGQALLKTNDLTGARAAWEKVLMLDDEQFIKSAQKALDENPLPEMPNQE